MPQQMRSHHSLAGMCGLLSVVLSLHTLVQYVLSHSGEVAAVFLFIRGSNFVFLIKQYTTCDAKSFQTCVPSNKVCNQKQAAKM